MCVRRVVYGMTATAGCPVALHAWLRTESRGEHIMDRFTKSLGRAVGAGARSSYTGLWRPPYNVHSPGASANPFQLALCPIQSADERLRWPVGIPSPSPGALVVA